MITVLDLDGLRKVFLQIIEGTEYTKNFGDDPVFSENFRIQQENRGKPKSERKPLIPYDGRKGYKIYDSGLFELLNESAVKCASMQARGDAIRIVAERDLRELAERLANGVNEQFPHLRISLELY